MPGRPKAGSAASRRGHASTAPQAAPLALPKKIEAAAEDGKAGVGLWVRSERVVGGDMDYTTTPATVWVRTEGAAYRLLAPAPAYARLYRPPGVTRTLTLTLTPTLTLSLSLSLTLSKALKDLGMQGLAQACPTPTPNPQPLTRTPTRTPSPNP